MQIKLSIDINPAADLFGQQLPKATPYIVANTLNKLGAAMQASTQKALPQVFDRPTPFTVRGVFFTRADKTKPTVEVYFPRSEANQGQSQYEYMRPGAFGTPRRAQKKSEFLMQKAGLLPAGWVTAPGSHGIKRLDQFGNLPGRIYTQIYQSLDLEASRRSGRAISLASQKRAAAAGVAREFFAVAVGAQSKLPPGVYQRVGTGGKVKAVKQWLVFTQKAAYKQRLDMPALAQSTVDKHLESAFSAAVDATVKAFERNK